MNIHGIWLVRYWYITKEIIGTVPILVQVPTSTILSVQSSFSHYTSNHDSTVLEYEQWEWETNPWRTRHSIFGVIRIIISDILIHIYTVYVVFNVHAYNQYTVAIINNLIIYNYELNRLLILVLHPMWVTILCQILLGLSDPSLCSLMFMFES